MRKYFVAAAVVVAVGVGVSLYLIPSSTEIAGQQAPTAAAPLAANVDVEAEYNAGHRSFPIISGLADKRVAAGDRPGAIKLLEEYVAANPTDVQGHKKLAEQYQLADMRPQYNQQLELIASAEPTEANLQVLSDIYNADKNYPKQVEVLKKILEINHGQKPQTFVDLATIQLVTNDRDGALQTLTDLKSKHPTFTSYPATRLWVTILAEKGDIDQAFQIAQDWVNTPVTAPIVKATSEQPAAPNAVDAQAADPRPSELADLCNILHYSGHPDKAVALVDPHIDMLERSPELVLAYVNADVAAGRADHAYALLQKIDEAQKMTPALYPIYLDLAIKREDIPAAQTIANKLDVPQFNEEQALTIIEIARADHAPSVLSILLTRFNDVKVLEGKPVLAAVISILDNAKDQDKRIQVALNTQLSGSQRIHLAESCARAQKTACFDAIIKQFPPVHDQSPDQVGQYAQLFIIADRPKEIIDSVTERAVLPNAHPDILTAQRRLAAAAGRMDILKPWLEANANRAPIMDVQELYYIANDHHQPAVASDVAQRLYARDPSPTNRDILANALVASGNYEKALPLIREQMKEPGANDGLYLAALSKLARKDPAARKELTDYAEAALRAKHGDSRQQMNYAYVLINNGKKDAALPYIRANAAEHGGEWKKMLAQLTQKPGKGGAPAKMLTREQRIEMANSKNISAANKRQIAFSLLKDGYKNDAVVIFQDLAKDKGPDSQEVKDLMFLWGGKLNADQLAWVNARAANATPYDKMRWSELVNNASDDDAVMRYVSSTPEALYNQPLRQRYFRILAETGSRQNYDTAMRTWVAQTTDVPALLDYSSTAQAYGYREAASNGYNRVLALDPNNTKALNQVAAVQFSKGKYSAAEKNLNQYLAADATSAPDAATAQAHFYKGELLRRQGNKAGSIAEYNQVIAITQQTGDTAPDALSRMYTAQFRVGQHDAAKAGFNQLLAQHPDDKGILADYMSALIEYNYLSEATRVANQYDKTSPYYNKGAMLEGRSAHVASVEQLSHGRELKINFDQPLDENKSPLKNADKLAWVENTTVGYDSVSISAKPGYIIRYMPTAQEQFAVVPATAPEVSPQVETQRQQDLRLQLLYARIEQDSGQSDKANQRIAVLKQYYPNDPQLISYQASLASANGDNKQALVLLHEAQTAAPENEDFALQEQNLKNAKAGRGAGYETINYAKLDQAYRGIGKNDEYITTGAAVIRVNEAAVVGFNAQNDILNTHNTRRASDGRFGNYDLTRQRGEVYGSYGLESGERVQVSVFGNNKDAGLGGYLDFASPLGNLELLGEYHRPYWDFVEAVSEYANRDRVGIKDYANLTKTLSLGLEASVNKYNIDLQDDTLETGLVRLSLIQQLQAQTDAQPYFGVGYGFDGEYKMGSDPKYRIDYAGNAYRPFPLYDREIHSLTGIYQDNWSPRTHARFVGGVAYDRMNDAFSPLVDGRIDYDINQAWQAGIRGRYALETNNTDNHELDLGADLIYKF